jgi:hypothetical protein
VHGPSSQMMTSCGATVWASADATASPTNAAA